MTQRFLMREADREEIVIRPWFHYAKTRLHMAEVSFLFANRYV